MPIEYDVTGRDTMPEKIVIHSGMIVSLGTAFAMALAVSASFYAAFSHQSPHDPLKNPKITMDLKPK